MVHQLHHHRLAQPAEISGVAASIFRFNPGSGFCCAGHYVRTAWTSPMRTATKRPTGSAGSTPKEILWSAANSTNAWAGEGEALKNMFPKSKPTRFQKHEHYREGRWNLFIEDTLIFSDSMAFGIFTIFHWRKYISWPPDRSPFRKGSIALFRKRSPIGKSISINCNGTKWDSGYRRV